MARTYQYRDDGERAADRAASGITETRIGDRIVLTHYARDDVWTLRVESTPRGTGVETPISYVQANALRAALTRMVLS